MEPVTDNEQTSPQGSRKRCPQCGASNKGDAQWCGQCLERFEETVNVHPVEDRYSRDESDPSASAESTPSEEEARRLDEEDAARLLSALAADTLTSMKTVDKPAPGDREAPPKAEIPTPPVSRATRSQSEHSKGAFLVGEEGITWKCLRCEAVNAMEASACKVCGTNFAEAIQPEKVTEDPKDPNKAAILSLAIPGAGHAYLGKWPEGVARAILSIWVVAVTVFAALQGEGQARMMAFLFGFVATALWLTAAHDAYREASGMSKYVLLKRKFFLYVVLGLLLMSIVMIFAAAITAGP